MAHKESYNHTERAYFQQLIQEQKESIARILQIKKAMLYMCESRGFFTYEDREVISKMENQIDQKYYFLENIVKYKLDSIDILIEVLEHNDVLQIPVACVLREIVNAVRTDSKFEGDVHDPTHENRDIFLGPPSVVFISKFMGRRLDLDNLNRKFENYLLLSCKLGDAIVISGMPGVGKTALIGKFLRENSEHLANINVIWIDASSEKSIRDRFSQAGRILTRNSHFSANSFDDVIKMYRVLCRCKSIIIFDNATSRIPLVGTDSHIAEFLFPEFLNDPKLYRPLYIVTTRTTLQHLWDDFGMMQIHPFSTEVAWQYLKYELESIINQGEFNHEQETLKQMSELYYNLPLALTHFVNVVGWDFDYKNKPSRYELDDCVRLALKQEPHIGEEIVVLLDTTVRIKYLWTFSLDTLQKIPNAGRFCHVLLDIMSVFSSEGIPYDFLKEIVWRLKNENRAKYEELAQNFDAALGQLKNFSFICDENFSRTASQDASENLRFIHIFLQQYVRRVNCQFSDHVDEISKILPGVVLSFVFQKDSTNKRKCLRMIHKNAFLLYDIHKKYVQCAETQRCLEVSLRSLANLEI